MENTGRIEPHIEVDLVRLYKQARGARLSAQGGSLDLTLADKEREHIKEDLVHSLKVLERGLIQIFKDCDVDPNKHA